MLLDSFFAFFFDLFGWKIVGNIPDEVRKATIAVAPHTTWIDFFIGLSIRAKIKREIGFLGKAELFKPPFGFIFRWFGGTPVIRNKNMNVVESSALSIINSEDKLFSLSPEGTRANVQKLRTGFYYISLQANVPIIRIAFDFTQKKVFIGEPFYASGNYKEDMLLYFVPFFKKVKGEPRDWIKNFENGKFDLENTTTH